MARIAIDMTSTQKNKTGIGRYIKNLVEALHEIDSINEYFLFIHDDDLDGFTISHNNFTIVPVNSKILRKTYLRIIWEQLVLPFRLKKLKIDLLHSPNFTTAYFSNLKKVVSFHDLTYFFLPEMHTPLKRELFKLYIRLSSVFSDAIVTISENSKEDIRRILPKSYNKTYVSPLGAAPNFYQPSSFETKGISIFEKYNLPEHYILYVGTIEPRKNILNLIKAYELLPSALKVTYKLVLTGKKGWLSTELFDYYEASSDKTNIIFSGFIDEIDLPKLFKEASVFAYVSHYEGFGIPLVESMACRTPLVTSNSSSMKEIAENAAVLVDPNSPQNISDGIKEMLTNSALKEQFKLNYPQKLALYNWEHCAKVTLEAYQKALKEK